VDGVEAVDRVLERGGAEHDRNRVGSTLLVEVAELVTKVSLG